MLAYNSALVTAHSMPLAVQNNVSGFKKGDPSGEHPVLPEICRRFESAPENSVSGIKRIVSPFDNRVKKGYDKYIGRSLC